MKISVQLEPIRVVLAVSLFAINVLADVTREKGDFRDGKVSVDLVSEVKSIRAGEPFTIGVRIIHAPGWHTYWKSPGVAGVPTVLGWDMPEGFKADSFQWPAPQRSVMAGMTVYGYEDEILLPMTIHPPASLKPDKDGKVRLKVRAAWMACEISCHPGWQDFVLELPVTEKKPKRNEEWREAFQQARDRMPVPANEEWDFDVEQTAEKITLTVKLPDKLNKEWRAKRTGTPYFFAEESQVKSSAAQSYVDNSDGSFSITMKTSEYAKKDTKQLKGILEFGVPLVEGSQGRSKWVRVIAPW